MNIILFVFGGVGLSMIVIEHLYKIDFLYKIEFLRRFVASYLFAAICGMLVAWILFEPAKMHLPVYGCVMAAISVFFSRYLNYLEAATLANLEVVAAAAVEKGESQANPNIVLNRANVDPQSQKSTKGCGSCGKKKNFPKDMIIVGSDVDES